MSESNRGFDFAESIREAGTIGSVGLWNTNLVGGWIPQGIMNQLQISMGNDGGVNWTSFGNWEGKGTKELAQAKFLAFMTQKQNTNGTITMQVPFSPSVVRAQVLSLQANDPLVHYLASDMQDIDKTGTNSVSKVALASKDRNPLLDNLKKVNRGYRPWGVTGQNESGEIDDSIPNNDLYEVGLKDPGVKTPDNWEFPTNKFPNVGWIGRVHRGTPWQTVYLKSYDLVDPEQEADKLAINMRRWQKWTGNENPGDAITNRPANDRYLFDLFTATFDENVTKGLLPVNQTNLASWSGVFGGLVVLSNNTSGGGVATFVVSPVAVDGPNGPLNRIYDGISKTRSGYKDKSFAKLGDVLATPELSDRSPYLPSDKAGVVYTSGLRDAVYEWLPQQVMGLLKFTEPRFVVYTYGQSLKPAPGAIITARPLVGPDFFGLCTNYQVTAEFATRSIVRVENPKSDTPRIVLENYNILPPD